MIYNRLYAKPDQFQCADQAGLNGPLNDVTDFLPGKAESGELSCEWRRSTSRRHPVQYNMMQSGDFSETIRSVSNTIAFFFFEKLCADQRATLLTDAESDEFRIAGGTKQGDPLSSLLFNSVLQSAMEKDIETWNEKGLLCSSSKE